MKFAHKSVRKRPPNGNQQRHGQVAEKEIEFAFKHDKIVCFTRKDKTTMSYNFYLSN